MKHIFRVFLALLLIVVMIATAACTSKNDELTPPVEGDETQATELQEVPVTLAEQVVYDANDIKITVTGLNHGGFTTDVTLLIENNSNKNILITARDLSVNTYMMDGTLYAEVAAGKKANEDISIMNLDLDAAGIETITDIVFYFNISDPETWNDIANSDLITLKTSATDYVQDFYDEGQLLYDENGIRVICRGLKQDMIWDGACVFYIENNSDQAVTVYSENVSVNGFMQESSLWADLRPGTRIVDSMSLMDLEDISVNSIHGIEEIEFNLKIIDKDTWDKIAVTDPFTLTFNEPETPTE